MFNLTMKSTKYFGLSWKNLDEHEGDFWRIDIVHINRKKYFLVSHEKTYFTKVIRATEFKSFEKIAEFINENCPWYRFSGISVGKMTNRKLSGTMTDMKNCLKFYQDMSLEEIEYRINISPYFALESNSIKKEIEKYVRLHSIQ